RRDGSASGTETTALEKAGVDPRRPWTRTQGPRPNCFAGPVPIDQAAPSTTGLAAKREGMAPMQWPDASFEAVDVMDSYVGRNVEQGGIAALFSLTNVPVGRDLPCTDDPELFFAEAPSDVEA